MAWGMAMTRTTIVAATLLALCAVASAGIAESDVYESGDEWVYDMSMTMESMILTGTITYSSEGKGSASVAGYSYDTYEIESDGLLTISGTLDGYTITGTASMIGTESVDQKSLYLIKDDANLSMSITFIVYPFPATIHLWRHGVSTYSPPGGVGETPEDPEEGESWTKTYTVHSEIMDYRDGEITTESSSISETRTYTYMGKQSVSVPAGTFECEVIQVDDGDSITTYWVTYNVGREVKSEYEAGFSQSGTALLKSYSYDPSPSGGISTTTALAISGVVIAVVVAVVVILLLIKRKSRTQEPPLGTDPPNPPAG